MYFFGKYKQTHSQQNVNKAFYSPDLPMTAKDFATMPEHLIAEVLPKKLIDVTSVAMIPLPYRKSPNQWI